MNEQSKSGSSRGGVSADAAQPAGPESKELLQYGGQAVIEGVMMRSPHYFAVACRKPDGTIVVQREEVDKTILGPISRMKWPKWPLVRGTFALLDAMALGTRALAFASNVQLIAEQSKQRQTGMASNVNTDSLSPRPDLKLRDVEASGLQASDDLLREDETASAASIVGGLPVAVPAQQPRSGKINDIAIGGTIVFSLVFAVVLFKLLPTLITPGLQKIGVVSASASGRQLNILDGVFRMMIFFGYILLISQMQQIKRVFMYHGAEHKAINTLEAGLPLTCDNALRASRIHPRCGTSFIFIVLVIDLIVVAFLPRFPFFLSRFLLQIAVVPVVAGLSYEIIKFAGKFRRNALVMAAFAPGMATQYLTTREPDAAQTEVALAALYSVLEAEGHGALINDINTRPHAANPDEPAAAIA